MVSDSQLSDGCSSTWGDWYLLSVVILGVTEGQNPLYWHYIVSPVSKQLCSTLEVFLPQVRSMIKSLSTILRTAEPWS